MESFQHTAGLHPDGIVGPQTRRALHRATAPMLGRGAGYGEPGGSVKVRMLQRKLRHLGLRPGPVDGLYGPLTAAAVARFQRGHDSPADGVAWSRTRHAIATARPAAETRIVRDDERTTRQTAASQPGSRAVDGKGQPVAPKRVNTDSPDDGLAGLQKASEVGLLVLAGLAACLFVTGAIRLGRKLAIAPAGATLVGEVARPVGGQSSVSSEAPLSQADRAEGEKAGRREDGDARVAAVGYVTAGDSSRTKAELRQQISALDAVCARRGWRLLGVARDIGDLSGTALDRPGLNYALERLEADDRFCLIVSELRRLGGSAAELGRVLGWLRNRGVRLVAVDVDLDTADGDGRIAADALISVGESAERGQLGRRGEWEAGDRRPGREAVRDLPKLSEHIVAMRSAGMTLQAIADRLNEEGVPTLRGGREWRPSSVQVAAGYRRPRRLSNPRNTYDRSAQRRGAEDR